MNLKLLLFTRSDWRGNDKRFEADYEQTNKIEINLDKEAKGYRMCVDYGKVKVPVSAAFISDSLVVAAAADGLILVDIEASAVVTKINTDRHADVFHGVTTPMSRIIFSADKIWSPGRVYVTWLEPGVSDLKKVLCTFTRYSNCRFGGRLHPQHHHLYSLLQRLYNISIVMTEKKTGF